MQSSLLPEEWSLRLDVLWARVLVWVASFGRDADLTPDAHFYFADRYRRLATHQRNQSVDYRRTDFFADLDLAASLDTDFFAAGFLAAAFLALVFLAEVFLAAVFFVVFFKTPALAASALAALPTGILLTCFATDVPAATAFVGTADLPCPTRLPITAPATPPTIAPAGPATMLPATAPVTAPAACLVSGTFGLEFDSFAMTAVYMRSPSGSRERERKRARSTRQPRVA